MKPLILCAALLLAGCDTLQFANYCTQADRDAAGPFCPKIVHAEAKK